MKTKKILSCVLIIIAASLVAMIGYLGLQLWKNAERTKTEIVSEKEELLEVKEKLELEEPVEVEEEPEPEEPAEVEEELASEEPEPEEPAEVEENLEPEEPVEIEEELELEEPAETNENTEMETVQEEPVTVIEKSPEDKVEALLSSMSVEDKVAQLFVILPEALTSTDCVTAAGEATAESFNKIPVGGFTYMRQNLQSEEQVKAMLGNMQNISMKRLGIPAFLCIDEEGGSVARISGRDNFPIPYIEDMCVIGENRDYNRAYQVGEFMGTYLSDYGFNVDFAPVADVLTNSENMVVRKRSFGTDPQLVSDMCIQVMKGLSSKGVCATYKHFPGHGMTVGDTHAGYAYSEKNLDQIRGCELIPFKQGIDQGLSFIMAAHISLPLVTGDNLPASISKTIITDLLRQELGYQGIVITDAMNMGAIAQQYSSAQAAILSLQAGADIILMPADFHSAYYGVLEAVKNGTLTEERINESLRRILRVKISMM